LFQVVFEIECQEFEPRHTPRKGRMNLSQFLIEWFYSDRKNSHRS
jgi:hypothetical protein